VTEVSVNAAANPAGDEPLHVIKRSLVAIATAAMTMAALMFAVPAASAAIVQVGGGTSALDASALSFGAMHQPTTGVVTSRFKDRCPSPDLDHYGIRHRERGRHTRIRAAYRGTVTFAGWQNGYGNVIYIRHRGGYETRYAHLSRIRVKVGQRVSRHQLIGHIVVKKSSSALPMAASRSSALRRWVSQPPPVPYRARLQHV
jgi:murein DD-endopeptidase MepM/ murein hydrolase activator NlpD